MAWIYDKNGQQKCEVKRLSYNGVFMDVSSITVTVESPAPIDFGIGDYIDWDYDGLRYTLDTAAGVEKQARSNSVGNAFTYENLVFLSPLSAAGNADFFDVILGNTNDFLTNTEFSFYGTAWDYAKRLEANLCRLYGEGTWKVRIWTSGTCYDTTPATGIDTGSWENKLVDVSGIKCLDGFQQMYDLWGCAYVFFVDEGVNYVDFYDDFEQYAKTWKVGGVDKIFAYGKGNGLYKIRHTQDADHVLVTRLRAYGSSDNIPANYYLNSPDYHVDGNESSELAISRLMLPASQWTKGGVKSPANAYLEQNADIYGVREGVVSWDGSDPELGEIKPTIYKLTIRDLLDLMSDGDSYRPVEEKWPDTTQRIDKIITGAAPTDNGAVAEAGYDFTVRESWGNLTEQSLGVGVSHYDVEFNDLVMGQTPSVSHLAEYRIVPSTQNKVAVSFGVTDSVANNIKSVRAYLTPYVGGVKVENSTLPCLVEEDYGSFLYPKKYNISLLDVTGNPLVFSTMMTGAVTFRIVAHVEFNNDTGGLFTRIRNQHAIGINLIRGNKAIDKFFSVTIPQLGFDLSAAVANGGKLCMRSGANQPREFQIVPSSVRYMEETDTWYLRCKRSVDQSTQTYYPNSDSVIAAGDEYYLTGIPMPSLYVEIAAQKLLAAATAWLNLHSKPRMLSSVDVDNKIMAVEGIVLKEGMSLPISDTDLGIAPQTQESRIIDNIRIEEGTDAVRTFSITLRDKKEKSSLDAAIRGATSDFATTSSVKEAVSNVETRDHDALSGRDAPNQHPMSSITGLEEALAKCNNFFELDGNGNVKLKDVYGGLWANGFGSFGGLNSGGGGGGVDLLRVWQSLTNDQTLESVTDTTKIALAHIPTIPTSNIGGLGSLATLSTITTSYITDLESWISGKGYVTSSGVTQITTGTGLTGGPITATGSISISDAYLTKIDRGETAYNVLSTISAALQSLQSQIDSIASINSWDEVTASVVSSDVVSATSGYIASLFGELYGNAATATKLATARTLWGQSFDGTGNVSGGLSSVTDISMTGSISGTTTIMASGLIKTTNYVQATRLYLSDDVYFVLDSNGVKLEGAGFYTDSFITAGGYDSGGGGGGITLLRVWQDLTNNPQLTTYDSNTKIAVAHIPDLSWNKITSDTPTTLAGYGINDAYTKTEVDNLIGSGESTLVVLIQGLQAQIDSLSTRNDFDELNATYLLSDVISASSIYAGAISLAGNDLATILANKQPLDADLTAIAALTGPASGTAFLKRNSDNSWSLDATTYVPTSRKINNKALSSDITLTIADIIGSTAVGSASLPIYYTGSAFATITNLDLLSANTGYVKANRFYLSSSTYFELDSSGHVHLVTPDGKGFYTDGFVSAGGLNSGGSGGGVDLERVWQSLANSSATFTPGDNSKIATAHLPALSGTGVTAQYSSTGSGATLATTLSIALNTTGVTAGTYPKVTVDQYGRVTAGTTLAASDIPSITKSKISDFPSTWAWSAITGTPDTLAGYGVSASNIVSTLGSTPVNRATADASGNAISTTYATIARLDSDEGILASAIQSLQAQIDAVSTRDDFDEINASVLFADCLSAISGDFGSLSINGIDIAASISALANRASTLEGYFDGSGNAKSALKLNTVSKTAWGQTYWTSGGVPTNISGNMTGVGSITMSGAISGATTISASGLATLSGGISLGGQYNDADSKLVWDSDANAWHLIGNFYADGFISAGGVSSGGSGGGVDIDRLWASLQNNPADAAYENAKFAIAHLPSLVAGTGLTASYGGTTLAETLNITINKNALISLLGLGDAAYKGIGSVASGNTGLVTGGAVWAAIDALPEPMLFKGSLGTGGTITTLPAASSANEGYTYKVITAGTYASQVAKIGDLFISNGSAWVWIPSGDEPSGTVTSVGMTVPTGLSVSGSPITSSGTFAITLTSGYVIPLSADVNKGVTAYGWGDHSAAGYAMASTLSDDEAIVSAALQALQVQIDSVSSRDTFDEISASVLVSDVISTPTLHVGAVDLNGSDLATSLTSLSNRTSTLEGYYSGGVLAVSHGGTGLSALESGKALIGNGANAVSLRSITNNTTATAVTASTDLITANTLYYHTGNSNITTVGTITSGTWNGSKITNAYIDKPWVKIGTTTVNLGDTITNLTGLGSISAAGALTLTTTKRIYFGDTDHYLELDSNGFHFSHGVYSEDFMSAGGLNSGGGGGGVNMLRVWQDLTNNSQLATYDDNTKIAVAHIPTSVTVGSTNYTANATTGVIAIPAYPTTLPASDVYSWAKASTKPSYTLDEISDGSTRKLSNYFLAANFTKANIKSTLEISDWALAASKPSYSFSEITGTTTVSKISDIDTWISGKGYVTSSGVTSITAGTGLTGGTITSTGTISISSDYQTYISNGNTAYNWGNHANAGYLTSANGTTISECLQALSARIDSVATRNDFDEVSATELFADTVVAQNALFGSISGSLSGNATTASYLSSSSYSKGSGKNPVYFSGGLPVASTSTEGSSSLPVYLNGGTLTAITASAMFPAMSSSASTNLSVTVAGQNRTIAELFAKYDTSGENISDKFTIVSNALQALQVQIDSVATKVDYDALNATAAWVDVLSASSAYLDKLTTVGAATLGSTLSVAGASTLSGRVGIGGAPDSGFMLKVTGNTKLTGHLELQQGSLLYFGSSGDDTVCLSTGSSAEMLFNFTHNAHFTSGIYADSFITAGASASSSDARLKDDISEVSFERAASLLMQLRGKEWTWNNKKAYLSGKHGSGLVAQEVENVMPWMVLDLNGEYSLNYNALWGIAIPVIQGLEKKIAALEKEIATLKQ